MRAVTVPSTDRSGSVTDNWAGIPSIRLTSVISQVPHGQSSCALDAARGDGAPCSAQYQRAIDAMKLDGHARPKPGAPDQPGKILDPQFGANNARSLAGGIAHDAGEHRRRPWTQPRIGALQCQRHGVVGGGATEPVGIAHRCVAGERMARMPPATGPMR